MPICGAAAVRVTAMRTSPYGGSWPVSDRWSGRRPFSLTPLSVQPSLKRHPLQYRDNGLCFPVWSDQAVIELPEDSSCADKSATPLCASCCACRNPLDPGRSLVSTCPVSVRIAVWTGEEMRERGSGIRSPPISGLPDWSKRRRHRAWSLWSRTAQVVGSSAAWWSPAPTPGLRVIRHVLGVLRGHMHGACCRCRDWIAPVRVSGRRVVSARGLPKCPSLSGAFWPTSLPLFHGSRRTAAGIGWSMTGSSDMRKELQSVTQ